MMSQGRLPKVSKEDVVLLRNEILVFSPRVKRWVRGKGFSLKELEAAGLNILIANRLGLPVDKRRKSTHEANIDLLRGITKKYNIVLPSTQTSPEKITKEAEAAKILPADLVVKIADQLVEFIDTAKRREVRKIQEVLVEAIRQDAPQILDKLDEKTLESIVNALLEDLSNAGLCSISQKFLTKKDWDPSKAKEMIINHLNKSLTIKR